jgi:transposase
MINIHESTRVFLCSEAIDMRLGFDGLAGLVKSYFSMSPTCGHLFVFFSRRRDRMKLLFWDREGFVLYYKRLERGTFSWLDDLDLSDGGEMEAADFGIILAGVNPVTMPGQKKERKKTNALPPQVAPLQLV